MTGADEFVHRVRTAMPHIKRGALRFWGSWFGRPYDNIHTIVGVESENDLLRLHFNEDEILSVWTPTDCIVSEKEFRIGNADRVLWEWFSYGRPKTINNLYFEDFRHTSAGFETSNNIDWYTPHLEPNARFPAVEIL